MNNYIHIILSTTSVYFFILISLRLLGKSELAQLTITDLIFVLLISNAVQNAMVGSDTSLTGGLLAASVLFIVNFILKRVKHKFPYFKKVMEGEPVILVYNGQINEKNCSDNYISIDELLQTIREHGSENIKDVNSVILEVDGNISVVSNQFKSHSKRKIKRRSLN